MRLEMVWDCVEWVDVGMCGHVWACGGLMVVGNVLHEWGLLKVTTGFESLHSPMFTQT